MKITQETDYALRIVDHLSSNKDLIIESSRLSQELVMPQRFILKILRKLNIAGITSATRGVNGGYFLKKDPAEITYKDVIEAIDGEIYINKCLESPDLCNRNFAKKCRVHKNLVVLQDIINKELDKYNFANHENREKKFK